MKLTVTRLVLWVVIVLTLTATVAVADGSLPPPTCPPRTICD